MLLATVHMLLADNVFVFADILSRKHQLGAEVFDGGVTAPMGRCGVPEQEAHHAGRLCPPLEGSVGRGWIRSHPGDCHGSPVDWTTGDACRDERGDRARTNYHWKDGGDSDSFHSVKWCSQEDGKVIKGGIP